MTITKCDICKKEIENREIITAGYGSFLSAHTFCRTCGEPIMGFLQKKKLIEKIAHVNKDLEKKEK